jgi:hypothetical protein
MSLIRSRKTPRYCVVERTSLWRMPQIEDCLAERDGIRTPVPLVLAIAKSTSRAFKNDETSEVTPADSNRADAATEALTSTTTACGIVPHL